MKRNPFRGEDPKPGRRWYASPVFPPLFGVRLPGHAFLFDTDGFCPVVRDIPLGLADVRKIRVWLPRPHRTRIFDPGTGTRHTKHAHGKNTPPQDFSKKIINQRAHKAKNPVRDSQGKGGIEP